MRALCPHCRALRTVRRDLCFARHSRHDVGSYCPGSQRDASAALAFDALDAAARELRDATAALQHAVAQSIEGIGPRCTLARARVAATEGAVEAWTVAALEVSGWERVDFCGGGFAWRDTHEPPRTVDTAEALRLARKDAGR